jgi:hypothetical protein
MPSCLAPRPLDAAPALVIEEMRAELDRDAIEPSKAG